MIKEVGRHTQLFTLRLWEEAVGQEQMEIRFKVQHVLSGEVRYFRDWSAAIDFCMQKLHSNVDEDAYGMANQV